MYFFFYIFSCIIFTFQHHLYKRRECMKWNNETYIFRVRLLRSYLGSFFNLFYTNIFNTLKYITGLKLEDKCSNKTNIYLAAWFIASSKYWTMKNDIYLRESTYTTNLSDHKQKVFFQGRSVIHCKCISFIYSIWIILKKGSIFQFPASYLFPYPFVSSYAIIITRKKSECYIVIEIALSIAYPNRFL